MTLELLRDRLAASENANPLDFAKRHKSKIDNFISHRATLGPYESAGSLLITTANDFKES